MLPYMTSMYGNPHSKTHAYGWETELAVDKAREHVASLLNASEKEIIFTSGATESNNMAIKGVAHFYRSKKNHIITLTTEHKCVLDSCRALESEGFEVRRFLHVRITLTSTRSPICLSSPMVWWTFRSWRRRFVLRRVL